MSDVILWTPALITTGLWADASNPLSAISGASWRDTGGSGRHFTQTTADRRPALTTASLNGLNTYRFDGSNDFFNGLFPNAMNLFQYRSGGAVFAVFQRSGGDDPGSVFFVSTGVGATPRLPRVGLSVTSYSNLFAVRRLDADETSHIEIARSGSAGVISCTFDFISGAASVGATGAYQNGYASSSGDMSSNTASRDLWVGARQTGTVERFSGDIAEVVVLRDLPDAATVAKIDGYLAWKWGLQGSLPSSHPYKLGPPVIGVRAHGLALPIGLALPSLSGFSVAPGVRLRLGLGLPSAVAPVAPPPDFRSGGRRVYALTISGDPLLSLPMASLQCRRRLGASTWLTVSVPSWGEALEADLRGRIGGQINIDAGNGVQSGPFLSAALTDVEAGYGPMGATITLTGRVQTPSYTRQARALFGVRSLSDDSGRRGCVCDVDPLLRPGDTVQAGEAEWIAGSIDYRIGPLGASMTVTEAANG